MWLQEMLIATRKVEVGGKVKEKSLQEAMKGTGPCWFYGGSPGKLIPHFQSLKLIISQFLLVPIGNPKNEFPE